MPSPQEAVVLLSAMPPLSSVVQSHVVITVGCGPKQLDRDHVQTGIPLVPWKQM